MEGTLTVMKTGNFYLSAIGINPSRTLIKTIRS